MDFIKARVYRVTKPAENFLAGELLVFLARNTVYFERAREDFYEYQFYNPETGEYKTWKFESPDEEPEIQKHFTHIGGWEIPGAESGVQKKEAHGFEGLDSKEILNYFLPYFKSFIEGDPEIENYFVWVIKNETLLRLVFNRGQFLKLKLRPFSEIKKLLEENGIPFHEHPRYKWMG